jgi:outer membrane protein assembly factor BamA
MPAALLLALVVVSGSDPAIPAGQPDASAAGGFAEPETITAIQVHGNTITSDDEIRRLAGVRIGAVLEETTVADVAARLRATGRFQSVEVRKRFASIADPSQVVLVVIVDEGPVRIQRTGDADHPVRVVRRTPLKFMVLPILGREDGYGVTFGVRLTRPGIAGARSRLSFPLTWGGDKKAGVELDKPIARGPFDRVAAGAAISRRTNPFYHEGDDRARVWVRAERQIASQVRAGAVAGWQRVSFVEADRFAYTGADVVLDTRLDPILPRNGMYARAAVEHLSIGSGLTRTELDGRGYLGLTGQSVLVLRAVRHDSDRTQPPYLKPLLGGLSNLRGFAAGSVAGDTLVATSAEMIVPLTSPLSVGKAGVSMFIDAGSAYDKGARLSDQSVKRGYGGSLWMSAAFMRFDFVVAHGRGSSTRIHVGGMVAF